MGKFKKIYNSQHWKRLREAKLRDCPICEYCQQRPATEVDHVVPMAEGGDPWDYDNLRSACHHCHSEKTASGERLRGCTATGMPRDPRHPWAAWGGDLSKV